MGCGVGFARLVAVSSWKVVDMEDALAAPPKWGKPLR
jgi:hypothetical protein